MRQGNKKSNREWKRESERERERVSQKDRKKEEKGRGVVNYNLTDIQSSYVYEWRGQKGGGLSFKLSNQKKEKRKRKIIKYKKRIGWKVRYKLKYKSISMNLFA